MYYIKFSEILEMKGVILMRMKLFKKMVIIVLVVSIFFLIPSGVSAQDRPVVFTHNGDIYKINSDGSNKTKIAEGKYSIVKLSPDGQKVAGMRHEDNSITDVFDIRGKKIHTIKCSSKFESCPGFFKWSNNNTEIIFFFWGEERKITKIWVNIFSLAKKIKTNLRGEFGKDYGDIWSRDISPNQIWLVDPNKERLNDPVNPGVEESNLYIKNLKTNEIKQITDHYSMQIRIPRFSPDGKKIVYNRQQTGKSEIWIVDKDGKNNHKLCDGEMPDW